MTENDQEPDGDESAPRSSDRQARLEEVHALIFMIADFAASQAVDPRHHEFNLADVAVRMDWSVGFAEAVAGLGQVMGYVDVSGRVYKNDVPSMKLTYGGVERVKKLKVAAALRTKPTKVDDPPRGVIIEAPLRRQQLFDVLPLAASVKIPPVRDNFIAGHLGASIFSAIGVLTTELRRLSGSGLDGHKLAAECFSTSGLKATPPVPPKIKVNTLQDDNDRSQQDGVMYLTMGIYAAVRNLTNHYNDASVDDAKAAEGLSTISFVLRHLPANPT